MAFSSSLEFAPAQDGEEAGIAARLNNRGYLAFSLKRIGAETYLHLTVRNGDAKKEEVKIPWQGGERNQSALRCCALHMRILAGRHRLDGDAR